MSKSGRFLQEKEPAGAGKIILKTVLWFFAVIFLIIALLVGSLVYVVKNDLYKDSGFMSSVLESDVGQYLVNVVTNWIISTKEGGPVTIPPDAPTLDDDEPVSSEDPSAPTEETTGESAPEPSETELPETEPPETEPTEATEPDYGKSGKIVNILLIGQDYRPDEEGRLADSIMLFTLNKATKTLTVTSFLRDSYVDLPNYRTHTCGWNRINTAYALGYSWYKEAGAMEMLNLTLKKNYGIEVDGDIEINFEAFQQIVNYMGGIEIELHGQELDYMNKVADAYQTRHFEEGITRMNGLEALEYARMRHSGPDDNDVKRAERQRMMIQKIMDNLTQMSLRELINMAKDLLPMVKYNITEEDMAMYITELLPYVFDIEIVTHQCPAEGTSYGEMKELPGGIVGGVLIIDFPKNRSIMMEITEG